MLRLVIVLLALSALAIGLWSRRRERQAYAEEEHAEERGEFWDVEEQDWVSKRQKADLKTRKEAFRKGTADFLVKQLTAYLQSVRPEWSERGDALRNAITPVALSVLEDVERFKKTGQFEVPAPVLSEEGEAIKKRLMAFVYGENPEFKNLGSKEFAVLNHGLGYYAGVFENVRM